MRFDPETAKRVYRETYAPLSDAGNRPPRVRFETLEPHGHVMTACPPGAFIRCELWEANRSRVTIREAEPDELGRRHHIADVSVHRPAGHDITTETIAIASALYWSWWRAMDMRGEAPEEADDAD